MAVPLQLLAQGLRPLTCGLLHSVVSMISQVPPASPRGLIPERARRKPCVFEELALNRPSSLLLVAQHSPIEGGRSYMRVGILELEAVAGGEPIAEV